MSAEDREPYARCKGPTCGACGQLIQMTAEEKGLYQRVYHRERYQARKTGATPKDSREVGRTAALAAVEEAIGRRVRG